MRLGVVLWGCLFGLLLGGCGGSSGGSATTTSTTSTDAAVDLHVSGSLSATDASSLGLSDVSVSIDSVTVASGSADISKGVDSEIVLEDGSVVSADSVTQIIPFSPPKTVTIVSGGSLVSDPKVTITVASSDTTISSFSITGLTATGTSKDSIPVPYTYSQVPEMSQSKTSTATSGAVVNNYFSLDMSKFVTQLDSSIDDSVAMLKKDTYTEVTGFKIRGNEDTIKQQYRDGYTTTISTQSEFDSILDSLDSTARTMRKLTSTGRSVAVATKNSARPTVRGRRLLGSSPAVIAASDKADAVIDTAYNNSVSAVDALDAAITAAKLKTSGYDSEVAAIKALIAAVTSKLSSLDKSGTEAKNILAAAL